LINPNQIFDPVHRKKWDKNLVKSDITDLSNPCCKLNHTVTKLPLNMMRDFVDKQMLFSHEGVIYMFYSYVEDSASLVENYPKAERGTTYFGAQKIYRRKEDNKIVSVLMMQSDLKMKITPKFIALFMPSGISDWFKKVNKYINDNYDQI
jgi:hypothetical protein